MNRSRMPARFSISCPASLDRVNCRINAFTDGCATSGLARKSTTRSQQPSTSSVYHCWRACSQDRVESCLGLLACRQLGEDLDHRRRDGVACEIVPRSQCLLEPPDTPVAGSGRAILRKCRAWRSAFCVSSGESGSCQGDAFSCASRTARVAVCELCGQGVKLPGGGTPGQHAQQIACSQRSGTRRKFEDGMNFLKCVPKLRRAGPTTRARIQSRRAALPPGRVAWPVLRAADPRPARLCPASGADAWQSTNPRRASSSDARNRLTNLAMAEPERVIRKQHPPLQALGHCAWPQISTKRCSRLRKRYAGFFVRSLHRLGKRSQARQILLPSHAASWLADHPRPHRALSWLRNFS